MDAKELEGSCYSAAGNEFPNAGTLRRINAELEQVKAELEAARTPGPDVSRLLAAAKEALKYVPGEPIHYELEAAIAEHEAAKGAGG